MLNGELVASFSPSLRLVSGRQLCLIRVLIAGPTTLSPQQCCYIGLSIISVEGDVSGPAVLSPQQISWGVCSIVIHAAYLYAEVCIVSTFQFVSKAHIRAYNNVSSAVLIAGPGVITFAMLLSGTQYCLLSRSFYSGLLYCLVFVCWFLL